MDLPESIRSIRLQDGQLLEDVIVGEPCVTELTDITSFYNTWKNRYVDAKRLWKDNELEQNAQHILAFIESVGKGVILDYSWPIKKIAVLYSPDKDRAILIGNKLWCQWTDPAN